MRLIAFSGIDGAGKTALIHEVHRLITRDHPDVGVATRALRVSAARERVTRYVGFPDPDSYLRWPAGQLYVLACAMDFCADLEISPLETYFPAPGNNPLLLSDRYVDCYEAFSGVVEPPCHALVETLLAGLPPADLTVHITVPPDIAWNRILARPGGPTPDESLEKLRRFAGAYERQFRRRTDVVTIPNDGSLRAGAEAVVRELLACGMVGGPRRAHHSSAGPA